MSKMIRSTVSFDRFWSLSADKIRRIQSEYDFSTGSPVFTINGRYTTRGWTEWTEGFVYGSSLLQFDATGEEYFFNLGRSSTLQRMAKHVSHTGVHDHGFNNVSTYGNLLRLMAEGRIEKNIWEGHFYRLALKCSGAVQASRWTTIEDGTGFIYSFNGPHSLFADTIRSLRSLAIAHILGQALLGEGDLEIVLLDRLLQHGLNTAKYIVYFGEDRDFFEEPGRVVHEAIFNCNNGVYRCPNTQQGFSPFTTWTRGLAWIITGFAEQLEFLSSLDLDDGCSNHTNRQIFERYGGADFVRDRFQHAATICADYYLRNTPTDHIPYWDTGAPGLEKMANYLDKPADPFNNRVPVDSSAAAIAAQGFLRLGRYTGNSTYERAGVAIIETLISEPYLSISDDHQGLLLHSLYHQPNGWDAIPEGRSIPCSESCMWGDYHLREAVLYLQRIEQDLPYHCFWNVGEAP